MNNRQTSGCKNTEYAITCKDCRSVIATFNPGAGFFDELFKGCTTGKQRHDALKKAYTTYSLKQVNGNRFAASRFSGQNKRTIGRHIVRFGIDIKSPFSSEKRDMKNKPEEYHEMKRRFPDE